MTHSMPAKELGRFHHLHSQAMNEPRECYRPGCTHETINSHVLQRRGGVLDTITENGKVRELRWASSKEPRRFNSVGVINETDVLAFPGFCGECDRDFFREIETALDVDDYKQQILFSYRALICELNKIDSWLYVYEKVLSDDWFSVEAKKFVYLKQQHFMVKQAFVLYQKHILENELNGSVEHGRFTFYTWKLPKVGVACSATYFQIKTSQQNLDKILGAYKQANKLPEIDTSVFIHALPMQDFTILIIGCDTGVKEIDNIPVKRLKSILPAEALRLLFNLLIKRVETWAISESFYQELVSVGLDTRILEAIGYYSPGERKEEACYVDVLGELEQLKHSGKNNGI